MTSLSCGVDALLRAAQYLQFLEEQESGQQLYRPIVLENPPMSTGTLIYTLFLCVEFITFVKLRKIRKNFFYFWCLSKNNT